MNHGPFDCSHMITKLSSLIICFLGILASTLGSAHATQVAEFTDSDYAYAFQYPSDWKPKKLPKSGEGDGVRIMVQSPAGALIMVTVGTLDATISRDKFEKSPNKQAVVEQMLDFTVEAVYRKSSRDIGASEMLVQKKERVPSEVGISLYISTLHRLSGERSVIISGLSVIPFGKRHMVSFIMTAPLTQKVQQEAPTLTRIFNSFHMLGERPR